MSNNSQFNIEVGTVLNTSNVPKQLQDLNTQLQKSNSKIVLRADGSQVLKTVNTLKDAIGNLYKQTQVIDPFSGLQIDNKINQVTENIKVLTTETHKFVDSKGAINTWTTTVDSAGQKIQTRVKEMDDGFGTITKTIDKYGRNAQGQFTKLDDTITTITQDEIKYAQAQAQSNKQTQRAIVQNKQLGQSFGDIITKVTKYYVATFPMRAVQTAVRETTESVKEFDKAITEMGKVTDYSGEQLKAYTRDLADMGIEVGRTMTDMTNATTGWLKAGYNEEDSAQLARYSALLQNTADEELSSAEATEILVSQLKAYNMEVDDTIKVTDILNKVSANQAVSSGDIAKGLTLASASMATFGNSIEETTALLTAGTTIFQGKSAQVARGLNMIATRVAKSKDDLEKYGVAIYDTSGDLRSTYDILVDLAPAWQKMSKAEQVALGNTLAGTNQYKILAAIMSQMDVAQESYQQALNSSGETMKQNAVYMEGLEAKTSLLKAEFEKLVIGKGGLQDFAKNIIQLGTNVLQLINNLGGLPSILLAIAGAEALLNGQNIIKLITSVLTFIPRLISNLSGLQIMYNSATQSIVVSNEAINASIPVFGLVLAAISAVMIGINAYNHRVDELNSKIRENILNFQNQNKTLQDNIKTLQDENISREELNTIIDNNFDSYEAERLKLLDVNDARKQALDLLKQEKLQRNQELVDTGFSYYEDTLNNLKNGYKEFDSILRQAKEHYSPTAEEVGLYDAKTAEEQINALNKYKYALVEQRSQFDENSLAFKNYTANIQNIESVLTNLKTQYSEDTKLVDEYRQALNSLGKTYDESTHQIITMSNEAQKRYERGQKYSQAQSENAQQEAQDIEDLAKAYNITTDDIIAYQEAHDDISYEDAIIAIASEKQALEDEKQTIEDIDKAWEESKKSVSTLVSSISKLSDALKEQEKNGELSLQTQLDLIDSGYSLALTYDAETGACKLDKDMLLQLVQTKYQAQIANLNLERSNVVAQLQKEANQALITASAFLELAKAKNIANEASLANSVGRGYSSSYSGYGNNFGYATLDETTNKTRQQLDAYNKEIKALEKQLDAVGKKGVGAFDAISDATKGAGSSAKDAQKDLNDLKSQYDKVISFITGRIDKVIRSIEKEKEKAIGSIDDQIDAKERQKDKALNNIEAQIDALEEQKNAREEYWDAEIDKLKESNDALKDQLELQEKLDALEKAKNTRVKVYKEGQGFVYDVDQTAVAEAQKALDEYLSEKAYEEELDRLEKLKDAEIKNYDDRIDALNKYKDNVEKSYEDQIANLKASRDALEEQYDAEIEYYNNYKDQFEEMVKAYEDQQTMLLAKQLTGIDFENNNWLTRLDNLAHFVNEYNKLQAKIGDGSTGNSASVPTSTSSSTSSSKSSSTSDKPTDLKSREAMARISHKAVTYASGSSSIDKDQIAIVGENPNKELVIGSKVNNGTLMALGKGDGVVNAKSTNTLAGLLNQLGNFGTSNFGSGNGILNDSHNESFVVNGVTIQGANITDPQSFVNGLLNMKAEALQRAYRHS